MIDLKFGQYPEKYKNNKNVSGNFSFQKTFSLGAVSARSIHIFLLSLQNNLYLFTQNAYGKSPTRFFSAMLQETREQIKLAKNIIRVEL